MNLSDPPRTLTVPGFGDLFGGSAEEVWRTGAPRHPRYAGLLNLKGNTSFVSSVAQVMLRIPSVAVFLASHVKLCRREPRESCVVCLLEKVQLELKMTGQELAKCKDHMPSSLLRNALNQDFAAESEHDAALCLQSFLHAAACEERRGERSAQGNYESPVARCVEVTHVERLFSFWEDQRVYCNCGTHNQSISAKLMLELPLLDQGGEEVTTTDLYLQYCLGSDGNLGAFNFFCSYCSTPEAQRMQRRVREIPTSWFCV